jgi:hypothetical protein
MELFAVTVKATMYLLAENGIAAENLASQLTEVASAELPGDLVLDVYAYYTPNQSDELKQKAINFEA